MFVEPRVPEPILPIEVLRHPVMARTLGVVFLVGSRCSAPLRSCRCSCRPSWGARRQAGQVLTPLFLGWVIMSVISAKATVKLGYRVVSMTGGVLIVLGFVGLTLLTSESPPVRCSSAPAS